MSYRRGFQSSDVGRCFLVHFEDGHWSVLQLSNLTDLQAIDRLFLPGVQMELGYLRGWRPVMMGRRMPKILTMTPVDALDQDDQHSFMDAT